MHVRVVVLVAAEAMEVAVIAAFECVAPSPA
jgi:hypothetical protein